uniref:Uncharacterized protein n=1 Tax=Amphimedon queenslandica TaxID=400682 RepID=A0A1X7UI82_AMPQE
MPRSLTFPTMNDVMNNGNLYIFYKFRMNHRGSGHYEQLKSQLEKQEEEIAIYKLQIKEQQADKEQLQKNYDTDMKRLLAVTKKQDDIESNLRRELKELQHAIETQKRVELDQLTHLNNKLKDEYDKIGKELSEHEEVVAKQKEITEALKIANKKLTEDIMKKETDILNMESQFALHSLQKLKNNLITNMVEKDDTIAALQQDVKDKNLKLIEAKTQLEAKQKMIHELVGNWKAEEAQCAVYKKDFDEEHDDRLKVLGQCEDLKQKLIEEKMKYRELQQKYGISRTIEKKPSIEHRLSTSMTDEYDKSRRASMEQVLKERAGLEKKNIELEQAKTEMEGRIDTLYAQMTQSQEKHKTEVSELSEKLNNEMKSNEQLANELRRMRKQHEKQIDDMRNANKVLMEKVLALERKGQDDESHHSNRISIDTSLINMEPQLTAEEMTALFRNGPAQQTHVEQEMMAEN